MLESFLEVEGRGDALEREAHLHHREGDVGLDPDDHRAGAAQSNHVGDVTKSAGRERIEHVEGGHVHDHALGPQATHPLDERIAHPEHVGVRQVRLDDRDEVRPLLENRDFHKHS